MRVVHFAADGFSELNSSVWRGIIPADAINRTWGNYYHILNVDAWMKDEVRAEVAQADLIIVERVLVEESVERCAFWSRLGKPIVIDIDDSYALLTDGKDSGNQAARFWKEGLVDVSMGGVKFQKRLEVSPLEQFRRGLKYCAGITMPSRILAEDWQMHAPCYYVPNYIDAARYLPHRKNDHDPNELVIGWGGSMSHKISFERSGVAEGLRTLFRENKSVKFLLAGDNRILDILKLPQDRVIYQPYVNFQDWPRVLSRMSIGIAPLQGRYDHSRSYIKSTEFLTMSIPFVATGCPTYQEFEDEGIGLYVPDGDVADVSTRAQLWYKHLRNTVNNYAYYKAKIDYQFELAPRWWMDNRVHDVLATYRTIIDRFRGNVM